jgi:predicted alpha-1,2-mannosidase
MIEGLAHGRVMYGLKWRSFEHFTQKKSLAKKRSLMMTHNNNSIEPVDYVNPLIGSNSSGEFSHGDTYPAAAFPFGMTDYTPQTCTDYNSDSWIYQYQKTSMTGIRATHEPSPWIGDYGDFTLMPTLGDTNYLMPDRQAKFSHDNENSTPYYYGVTLNNAIDIAVTPTVRCSSWEITFPTIDDVEKPACLVIDTSGAAGNFTASQKTVNGKTFFILSGIASRNHGGVANTDNFGCRFMLQTTTPFTLETKSNSHGIFSIAILNFNNFSGGMISFNLATSFISFDQAELNLSREIGDQTFEQVKAATKSNWNTILAGIQISGANEDQLKTFYSCFYRTQLFPRIFYEYNADNEMIHYSPYNGKIEKGYLYTDNGFWDTFRTVYPFFSIMFPDLDANMIRGWINAYNEGDWFPKWASPGYRVCMIGTPMSNIITDALYKGVLQNFSSEELTKAYEGCYKDATNTSAGDGYGRKYLSYYINEDYVPMIPNTTVESTSRTLEFSYNDYCLAAFAKYLGKNDDYDTFIARAGNYKTVFNPKTGFFEGRFENGQFDPDFSPIDWGGPANGGGPFTEGAAWQYEFYVPHDISGLIKIMNGESNFEDKLDLFFDKSNNQFNSKYYSGTIHEEREMVACNMGQYAHNNQPVHSFIYTYNYIGKPWKAAPLIRNVVDKLYTWTPEGYPGDDDNGEMSAWYLFGTLGFYPVCPGTSQPYYVIGTPRFSEVKLQLANNKTFTITSNNNSDTNLYIQSASLNGEPYTKSWISHKNIMAGGTLTFEMGPTPNKNWGSAPGDWPVSTLQS